MCEGKGYMENQVYLTLSIAVNLKQSYKDVLKKILNLHLSRDPAVPNQVAGEKLAYLGGGELRIPSAPRTMNIKNEP